MIALALKRKFAGRAAVDPGDEADAWVERENAMIAAKYESKAAAAAAPSFGMHMLKKRQAATNNSKASTDSTSEGAPSRPPLAPIN